MSNDSSDSLREKLLWHAGLSSSRQPVKVLPIFDASNSGQMRDLELSGEDFLDGLQDYNLHLNGSCPSETIGGSNSIPQELAYAIMECIRVLGDPLGERTPENRHHLLWRRRIEIAWSAVLAGDIDDIKTHISLEEM